MVIRGDLRIDVARREVSVGGEPVSLTAREFDLLVHLARHAGRVLTVWGVGYKLAN